MANNLNGNNKVFLGWGKSFISSLVEFALSTSKERKSVTLVLPSLTASADINIELLKRNESSIEILTLSQFLPSLTRNKIANTSIKNLCWKNALTRTDPEKLNNLFPAEYAFKNPNLSSLAKTLNDISEKIHTSDKTFEGLAREVAESKIDNAQLWNDFSEISKNYLKILTINGYCDLFYELVNTPNFKIKNQTLIFAACHNLTNQTDRIIKCIAQSNEVILAINSTKEFELGFSESGALIPQYWEKLESKIADSAIHFCNSTEAEVEIALASCKKTNNTNLVLLDTSTLKLIDSKLSLSEIRYENRFPQEILNNNFIRLISHIVNYCSEYSTKELSRLIREPLMRTFLKLDSEDQDLIGDLNKLVANYFPEKLELNCPILINKLIKHENKIKQLSEILENFKNAPSIEVAISTLVNGFGLEPNEEDAKCLSMLLEHAAKIDALAFDLKGPPLELLSELIQTLSFNSTSPNADVKITPIGDAMTSSAEQIVVLSASDDNFPKREAYLPFLSKQLLRILAIEDYSIANSSYFATYLAHSKAKIKIICPRQSIKGEPLTPSRFLFKASSEDCAKRVLAFTNAEQIEDKETHTAARLKLNLPTPIPNKINKISASSFKDYILCPYLFYLKHVIKLQSSSAREEEMGAAIFGHLAHKIIEMFSRNIKDGAAINDLSFKNACDLTISEHFPWAVYPAVRLQIEQLKYRIGGIVNLQKTLSDSGWEILEVELNFEDTFEQVALEIKGKIDRVDINTKSNTIRIIDFKTSDKVIDFKQVHNEQGWTDLQLPLYANWISKKHPTMSIEVAYVNLPKQLYSHSISCKTLGQEEITAAVKQAEAIAKDIIADKFSPPSPENWPYEFKSFFL